MTPLLAPGEPAPFATLTPRGASPIVLVCEHAGRQIPAALGTLGLADERLARHYMWDLGALDLARALSQRLDAPLLAQRYSRMVCDCNRAPDMLSYIPDHGEGVPVPGNLDLTPADRTARTREVWQPFQAGVAAFLDARRGPVVLVSIHSFTPVFYGHARSWHAGILHDRDPVFSRHLLAHLRRDLGDLVGDNEPYRLSRDGDYVVPVHGEDRGLPCAEIEVRNDLIADPAGVAAWADRLAVAFATGLAALGLDTAA